MPVIRAVFISVLVHFLLMGTVIWIAPKFQLPEPETIEVELTPEAQIMQALKPKEQQIVRQAIVPEKMKLPEDDTLAKFLSEQKQRVKEETRAAQSGMTTNRSNQAAVSEPKKPTPTPPQRSRNTESHPSMDKDGFKEVDISKDLQEMNRFNEGMSTIGETMPNEMKVGSFTALNTDRYLFYTFYARMEELVRYRWESRVQQAIDRFDRLTLVNAGNRNWVTHIEFLLDKNGYLRQSLIMKSSGIPAFDAAAVNAFRDAKVFPNPPPEMVQEDGYIHIKFSFTVNYAPPVLVNRN
ncbi:cell envelope integrity protein TolA [Bdellovibrio bacteriovorus]|uniref:Energy transducer TonB n=1 Tax=Bdellovibrio bacteriovorus TaxID=959 RepID=A0A150WJ19_BDEBC|nr:cell envelope integrity protein TolA [Bdellovibrio bacteriovorus]KYG63435.1 energy transducer TonB [Bdellovibrio bacteriovorus]